MPATASTIAFDRTHNIGDLVTISPMCAGGYDPTRVYRIKKVPTARNQVNYAADPVDGRGQGVRGKAYSFLPYEGEAPEAPEVPVLPELAFGAMVLINPGRYLRMKQRCPYVVLDIYRDGSLKLAELGGARNADGAVIYWPKIARDAVTELDFAELFDL